MQMVFSMGELRFGREHLESSAWRADASSAWRAGAFSQIGSSWLAELGAGNVKDLSQCTGVQLTCADDQTLAVAHFTKILDEGGFVLNGVPV